ncbi:hypothetical protein BDW42DRAFT_35733 [Aspergillus taichungensis]|uniref:Uncharacterized protein n=1 Tax=Aspergillus taichungensis TaxID=482145 RepID=A0A2J5I3V8_9EURO|nr:hypothetical protein BDW42DRAFT_35733 [Aspergillus taichungensis]
MVSLALISLRPSLSFLCLYHVTLPPLRKKTRPASPPSPKFSLPPSDRRPVGLRAVGFDNCLSFKQHLGGTSRLTCFVFWSPRRWRLKSFPSDHVASHRERPIRRSPPALSESLRVAFVALTGNHDGHRGSSGGEESVGSIRKWSEYHHHLSALPGSISRWIRKLGLQQALVQATIPMTWRPVPP